MPRVLITGDRHWHCPELAARVVARLIARHGAADLVIIHGGARGIDTTFDAAARSAGLRTEPHPARWDPLGPAAGPIRNQEMVDAGAAFCVAVHRDLTGSKGTRDCVNRCLRAGIPVWLVEGDRAEPRRVRSV